VLTRQRIVESATALIDSEGLAAVSTRRLAAELGVAGPSLYNHFRTKEEILDAVADAVVARVDVSVFADHDWREALRLWAGSYRAALAEHPNIVPFLVHGPARRPAALRMADAVYGALVAAGWPRGSATRIGAMMRYFVAGSSLGSFARGFVDDAQIYAEHYPHLSEAHLLHKHQREVDDGAFELGLSILLDGLALLHAGPTDASATDARRRR
jgi:AcrR family transcriptional regulator